MARTVDPQRHQARRIQIIEAAITCFAAHGYAGTSTAALCRTAGIGSGTLFHYFPAKRALLLAILDLGVTQTQEWFAARPGTADPLATIEEYVRHAAAEFGDPRTVGLVRALGAVVGDPDVDDALRRDSGAVRDGLLPQLVRAQRRGQVRSDLSPEDLAAWVLVLLDGFVSRLASDPSFTLAEQREHLVSGVLRVLLPAGGGCS